MIKLLRGSCCERCVYNQSKLFYPIKFATTEEERISEFFSISLIRSSSVVAL